MRTSSPGSSGVSWSTYAPVIRARRRFWPTGSMPTARTADLSPPRPPSASSSTASASACAPAGPSAPSASVSRVPRRASPAILLSDVADTHLLGRYARRLLRQLVDNPEGQTLRQLQDALYCDAPDGGPISAKSTLRKWIFDIRGALLPGWTVNVITHGSGYRLERGTGLPSGRRRPPRGPYMPFHPEEAYLVESLASHGLGPVAISKHLPRRTTKAVREHMTRRGLWTPTPRIKDTPYHGAL